jgi:hypothetical protein
MMRERGEVATAQYKKTVGHLTDYSLNHIVSMRWGEDFKEDKRDLRPFQFKVDGKTYLLSWGELKDMDTAGFFRREEGNPKHYKLRFFDGSKITVSVDLNDEATRDYICCFIGDDFEVFLDWYEVLRYGRFI